MRTLDAKSLEYKTKVYYLGFVYIQLTGDFLPGTLEAQGVREMFRKKNIKKTRELHPLYARGFSDLVQLKASADGLRLEDSQGSVVFETPIKKIPFVAAFKNKVLIFVSSKTAMSTSSSKFTCYALKGTSVQEAQNLSLFMGTLSRQQAKKKLANAVSDGHLLRETHSGGLGNPLLSPKTATLTKPAISPYNSPTNSLPHGFSNPDIKTSTMTSNSSGDSFSEEFMRGVNVNTNARPRAMSMDVLSRYEMNQVTSPSQKKKTTYKSDLERIKAELNQSVDSIDQYSSDDGETSFVSEFDRPPAHGGKGDFKVVRSIDDVIEMNPAFLIHHAEENHHNNSKSGHDNSHMATNIDEEDEFARIDEEDDEEDDDEAYGPRSATLPSKLNRDNTIHLNLAPQFAAINGGQSPRQQRYSKKGSKTDGLSSDEDELDCEGDLENEDDANGFDVQRINSGINDAVANLLDNAMSKNNIEDLPARDYLNFDASDEEEEEEDKAYPVQMRNKINMNAGLTTLRSSSSDATLHPPPPSRSAPKPPSFVESDPSSSPTMSRPLSSAPRPPQPPPPLSPVLLAEERRLSQSEINFKMQIERIKQQDALKKAQQQEQQQQRQNVSRGNPLQKSNHKRNNRGGLPPGRSSSPLSPDKRGSIGYSLSEMDEAGSPQSRSPRSSSPRTDSPTSSPSPLRHAKGGFPFLSSSLSPSRSSENLNNELSEHEEEDKHDEEAKLKTNIHEQKNYSTSQTLLSPLNTINRTKIAVQPLVNDNEGSNGEDNADEEEVNIINRDRAMRESVSASSLSHFTAEDGESYAVPFRARRNSMDRILETSESGPSKMVSVPDFDAEETFSIWFHGITSRENAEGNLAGKPPGSFCVRVAQTRQGYSLSLVLLNGSVNHFMINVDAEGLYRVAGDDMTFSSLVSLVQFFNGNYLNRNKDKLMFPSQKR